MLLINGYVNIPEYGSPYWKDPVPTAVDLPTNGNTIGDVRVTLDTQDIYIWSGTGWVQAAQGTVGGITALTGDVTAAGNGVVAATLTAITNNTITTLSALSLPGSQVTGNISGNAANITATSNSTLTTLSALSLPGSQVTGNISGNAANITATSNSTLTTLSALSLPGSQVTGNISGNAAGFTGSLSGDVTGGQSTTSIASTVVTSKVLTGYTIGANTPIAATDTILAAFEKVQGQINATDASAITSLSGDVTATGPGAAVARLTAVTNSTITTLSALSLPGSQVTGNISGASGSVTGTNVITNTNLAQMPANTLKGNNTGSTANAADLTTTQVTAMLNAFTGDSGSGGVKGLVPAPTAGQAEQGNFLGAGGAFSFVDVTKPIFPNFSLLSTSPMPSGTIKDQTVAIYTYQNNIYALVSGGNSTATITVFNVTDPNNIEQRGNITLSGTYGASVYFSAGVPWAIIPSSGGSHLYTVNLSNPNSLSIGGNLLISGTPGSLYSAVASNGYVYISTQNTGLVVVDIGGGSGSLTSPVQVFQEGSVKSFGIAIAGSTLYTTNYQTTFPATVRYLKTWSLATPSTPSLQNTYTIPGGPTATSTKPGGIAVSGNTAVVTDINQLVYDIIDITTPTSPNYLAYITPTATVGPGMIALIESNYLYLPSGANATNGAYIDFVDITSRSSPVRIANAYNGVANAVGGGIATYQGYIYLADYGVAPGSTGALDIFTAPYSSLTAGVVTASHVVLPGGDVQTQINALAAGAITTSQVAARVAYGA